MDALLNFFTRFALNFLAAFIIIRLIYYPKNRHKEYFFTFFTFNTVIFFVSILLRGFDFSVGFGFGLFAIFSILRYRTEAIPIKETSYLFALMSLPFINALFELETHLYVLLFINGFLIVLIYLIENELFISYHSILYSLHSFLSHI